MMRSMAGIAGSFVILVSLMVVAPTVVVADDTYCDDVMYGGYYDDVYVPYGASCKLVGATVEGNIKVKARASLVAIDTDVDGNIQGRYARKIIVRDSNIEGNVQAKKTRFLKVKRSYVDGDVQTEYVRKVRVLWSYVYGNIQVDHAKLIVVEDNYVGGDIQVYKSFFSDKDSFVSRNEVDGNVQVFENRIRFSIYENWIYGNLQCKDNYPPPVGGDNMVEGDKEDQCRYL